MFFELVNALIIFQTYINHALKSYIDVFCVVYLDDVLIYSKIETEHWEHVRKILRVLLTHRLYVKLSKCVFNKSEIIFLRFVIDRHDIQMKQTRIEIITEWSMSKNARDILIFLGFAGFYRRFIQNFFKSARLSLIWQKKQKKEKLDRYLIWRKKQ